MTLTAVFGVVLLHSLVTCDRCLILASTSRIEKSKDSIFSICIVFSRGYSCYPRPNVIVVLSFNLSDLRFDRTSLFNQRLRIRIEPQQ
ncbi:hypothetical protein GGI35DRAFT_433717 [Trichoderma velutinum]